MKRKVGVVIFLGLIGVMAWAGNRLVQDQLTASKLDKLESWVKASGRKAVLRVRAWEEQHRFGSWLCGPTSFAFAQIVNERFFEGLLPVRFFRGKGDCIRIVIGTSRNPTNRFQPAIHCWVEIFWNGLVIYLDPTYGQYDQNPTPVFSFFEEKDLVCREVFMQLLCVEDSLPPWVGNGIDQILRGDVPEFWWQWTRWLAEG